MAFPGLAGAWPVAWGSDPLIFFIGTIHGYLQAFGDVVAYGSRYFNVVVGGFYVENGAGRQFAVFYGKRGGRADGAGNAVYLQVAANGNAVFSIFCGVDGADVGDAAFKSGLGVFGAFHVIVVEMLFHEGFVEMKGIVEQGELEFAGCGVEHADDLVIVGPDVFEQGFGEEGEPAVLGKILLGLRGIAGDNQEQEEEFFHILSFLF